MEMKREKKSANSVTESTYFDTECMWWWMCKQPHSAPEVGAMQRVSVKVSGELLVPHCFCFCIFGLGLLLVCMASTQEKLDLNWKSKTDWNSLISLCPSFAASNCTQEILFL